MSVQFTYHGGMCISIVRSDGFKIIVDPWLRGNPQAKTTPDSFKDCNLVMVTHNAYDHFGDAAEIMEKSNAVGLMASDCILELKKRSPGLPDSRFTKTMYGDTREFGTTIVRTVMAFHASKSKQNGIITYGTPLGFVIHVEPGITYYHPGDTSLYGDFELIRKLHKPNVMCVGISGIKESSPREMTEREAAMAVSMIGADVAIPTHYIPGDPCIDVFKKHMESFAPETLVYTDVDMPFRVHPFCVEY